MPEKYVLASDLGSGGCKTLVLDSSGRVVSSASAEYPTFYPQPGWVEQNPDDWYQAFTQTTRQVIAQANIPAIEIVMVSLVAVTHNAVLVDSNDRPLRNCILTFDQRSTAQCRQILARWGEQVQQQTLNAVAPLWTWPQLLWIKENEPDLWQATYRILFQKDYVRHRLAPAYVTDTIDAAGSLLFNPLTERWVDEFCADLGLSPTALPQVVKPMDIVSKVSQQAAQETGLAAGTPVCAV